MNPRVSFAQLRAATAASRAAVALATALRRRRPPPPSTGPLRVLLLASQPASHAGTRHRLAHWAERLRRDGHHVELSLPVEGAFGEELFLRTDLTSRHRQHLLTLSSRRRAVARGSEFDVAVIHMTDLPAWEYGAPFIAAALTRSAGRVLLDLDDLPVVRGEDAPGARARRLVATVDGLIVGNAATAAWFPDRPSWRVPTCLDVDSWPVPERTGPPVLGWIGTGGGLAPLEALAPTLAAACARHGARLRVVCDVEPRIPGVPLEFVAWRSEREIADLAPVAIGLAPLVDGAMTRCKCGLKALQYMAGGAAVVASPVGALADIVVPGETGLHARTDAEWTSALDRLLGDPSLARRMGIAGREAVRRRWSFDVHARTFEAALRGLPC